MDMEVFQPRLDIEKNMVRYAEKNSRPPSSQDAVSASVPRQNLPDREKIASAMKAVESYLHSNGTNLKFVLTDKQKMQVEVLEADSKKLIRKIPSDEMLNLAEAIEKMTGVFVNNKV